MKIAFNGNGDTIPGSNINTVNGLTATSICPIPCSDSLFARFGNFQDVNESDRSYLSYDVINPLANGGIGEVVQSYQIIDSLLPHLATMPITRHANNQDYWLIARAYGGNAFHAWQVTPAGVVSSPVVSVDGPFIPEYADFDFSAFSPDGNYLAVSFPVDTSILDEGLCMLYHFDNATGQFEFFLEFDKTNLPYPGNNYSVCFSPDGTKLFVTSANLAIWQYDVSSGDSLTIATSGKTVVSYTNPYPYPYYLRDMEVGLNGKIYVSRFRDNLSSVYMGVINNPNDTGSACNFTLNGLNCGQWTNLGLPRRIHNLYVHRDIDHDSLECTGDTTTFYFDNYAYFDSAQWFIDTGANQVVITSDSLAQIVFDSAGTYPIMAVSYSGCRLDTFFDTVMVLPTPMADLGSDTILCEGDTIALANTGQFSYLWSTGDTTEGIQVLQPDTFWLALSNYCGADTDTIVIDSIIEALVIFPTDDTLLCDGDTLMLDAAVDQGAYLWHDGSTDSIFYVTQADSIWAEASNACGVSSDTIQVRFTDLPELPDLNRILCHTDTHFIDLTTDSLSRFLWYSGDTTAFDTIVVADSTYWVKEWNICGSDSDTFALTHVFPFTTDLGADTIMCGEDTLRLDAFTAFGTYSWHSGDTASFLTMNLQNSSVDSVTLWVEVTNACMADTDSVTILVDQPIDLNLGEDPTVCIGDSVTLQPQSPVDTTRIDLVWSDGHTGLKRLFVADQMSSYYLSATNLCGVFTDSITVRVDKPLSPNLGADRSYCYGDTIELFAGEFMRTSYQWAGIPDSSMIYGKLAYVQLNHSGWGRGVHQASIQVTNACGSAYDTVVITVDSLPSAFPQDSVLFCEGAAARVSVGGVDVERVEWMDGSKDTVRKISSSALWEVTFFNHCGKSEQVIPIQEKPLPIIHLANPQLLCNDVLVLSPEIIPGPRPLPEGQAMYTYQWSDGSDLDQAWIYEVGTYGLRVTDRYGCVDSVKVTVKTCGPEFYLSNAFTPTGDLLNERWHPKGEGLLSYTIWIYDRWGNVIHSFTQDEPGWDGESKGELVQQGVYHWKMEYTSQQFAKPQVEEGTVTVLR